MTPAHAQIMKLCIVGKLYSQGAKMGKVEMTQFRPERTGLEGIDVISYFYYLGYIHMALKDYSKAVESFRLALIQPTASLHLVMIRAYQKYLLASMLAGTRADFPKAMSSFMKSYIPRLCSSYKALHEAMAAVRGSWNCLERCQTAPCRYRAREDRVHEGQELCKSYGPL